jgi:lysozyme
VTLSDAGLRLIKEYEGLRTEAYRCPAGVWTIGYGSTRGVREGMRITEAQAESLLRQDVERFERAVVGMVEVPITQGQFDALVSFAFNLGAAALRRSTLLRLLNQSRYAEAASQFPRWNKAGGRVLAGLTKRRSAERALFEGRA